RSRRQARLESLGRPRRPGLSVVVNTLDPDILVLGGGIANVDELYDDLPPRLADETFSPCFYTPIVRAAYADSSGVRGAAWLWR
ncbi:MAG TPA: ROK family protein, partial [Propionibacteriaceae bacterium]|nr:ROK family protein [Propionibacteriaceae bacterium]